MDPLTLVFFVYLLAAAAPALIARWRGLSPDMQSRCFIGALLTGWSGVGWLYFALLALYESPALSISTTIYISSVSHHGKMR
jgi:hypothetical protein